MTTIAPTIQNEQETARHPQPKLRAVTRSTDETDTNTGFDFDVAIVGLGYVGLPTAISYHAGGSRVLGLDASEARLATITRGGADLLDRDQHRLSKALTTERLLLTSHPRSLARAAAVVICVPTPVDNYLTPDLRMLEAACATVVANAVPGQLLLLTSTTYVGCTEDLLVGPLRERGFEIGEDIFVAFSAERIDPGNDAVNQEAIPRVVGGATPECEIQADLLLRRYANEVHHVGSLAAAEMTKLLENTFRAVNIALANEFADICAHLGIPVNDVIDAAATKPYGFMAFRPGPGVGGHCIPCDPHYLLWQLRKQRVSAPIIERTMTEIASRPGRVVERAQTLLSENGVPLSRARILVVGISYKADVADLRESPALEILSAFARAGAHVGFVDHHFDQVTLESGDILPATRRPEVFQPDLVLIHTRHSDADLDWVTASPLVLDPRYPDAVAGAIS
jgi:nucleotide sugar dehydrogenase